MTGPVTHKLLFGYEYDHERSRFTQSNLTNVSSINVLTPVYAFNSTRRPRPLPSTTSTISMGMHSMLRTRSI
jgi:hypothetical protein